MVPSGWTDPRRPCVAGWIFGGLPHNRTAAHWPPALAAWWIVHPRALSESSSDSEGPKTGCLEHLVPGSLRGGFGWQPALACGWPPFTQVTGLLAAFLAAGVDWRLSWFRMILDPRMIRMIICSWSSLEPGADLGVGSWSYVCLLCRCASFCGGARRAFLSAGTGAWCLGAWSLARVRGGPCASIYAGSRPKVSCDNC